MRERINTKARRRVKGISMVIPTRARRQHRGSRASLFARAVIFVMVHNAAICPKRGKPSALIGETEGLDSDGPSRVNPL